MPLYFAYGSNMHPEQMKYRCPDAEVYAKAALHDFTLCFPVTSELWSGQGVASISGCPGERVEGVVYEVSDWDLEKLDQFEGVGIKYQRMTKAVQTIMTPDPEELEVFVYEALPENGKRYLPSSKYIQTIIDGARHHRLSASYISRLAEWAYPR